MVLGYMRGSLRRAMDDGRWTVGKDKENGMRDRAVNGCTILERAGLHAYTLLAISVHPPLAEFMCMWADC